MKKVCRSVIESASKITMAQSHDDICEDRFHQLLSDTVAFFYLKTSISIARSFLFYRRFLSSLTCACLSPLRRLKSRILHSLIRATGFPLSMKTHPPRARHQHISRFSLADLLQKVMKTQIIYARHANFELLFCLRARACLYLRGRASMQPCCVPEKMCKQSFAAANGGLCARLNGKFVARAALKQIERAAKCSRVECIGTHQSAGIF
jgi:hypothetical protein